MRTRRKTQAVLRQFHVAFYSHSDILLVSLHFVQPSVWRELPFLLSTLSSFYSTFIPPHWALGPQGRGHERRATARLLVRLAKSRRGPAAIYHQSHR